MSQLLALCIHHNVIEKDDHIVFSFNCSSSSDQDVNYIILEAEKIDGELTGSLKLEINNEKFNISNGFEFIPNFPSSLLFLLSNQAKEILGISSDIKILLDGYSHEALFSNLNRVQELRIPTLVPVQKYSSDGKLENTINPFGDGNAKECRKLLIKLHQRRLKS